MTPLQALLAEWSDAKGWSQRDWEAHTGLSKTYVHKLLHNQHVRAPGMEALEALRRAGLPERRLEEAWNYYTWRNRMVTLIDNMSDAQRTTAESVLRALTGD